MIKSSNDVGILTFHCADNYGAMLQAYALKKYLLIKGLKVEIIPYEPAFMTGRHWWFPYIPMGGLLFGWKVWIRNLHMGKAFFLRRNNMKYFRGKYLVENRQKKIFFLWQLRDLSYQCYIVGSDQIWNPDITLGLRPAYFGAFHSKRKKKVISYAASLGKASLSKKYDTKFFELIKSVDVISVREEDAVPYVKQFFQGNVTVVPDPVLLLKQEEWQKIERLTDMTGYILFYMTEKNEMLIKYAKKLSYIKKIPVIELRSGVGKSDDDFLIDYVAGPSEFLGYIHNADYVLTNSFHGVAFSIIYHKTFFAFLHESLGARVGNILKICELEDRLYQDDESVDIDRSIKWSCVEERINENRERAARFIMDAVR